MFRYIFSVFTTSSVLAIRRTSRLRCSPLSSADESLKDETRLLLLWVGSLLTLHTFVFTHITSMVKPVHTFMARSRISKSRLKAELCLNRYVHFSFVPIYIYTNKNLIFFLLSNWFVCFLSLIRNNNFIYFFCDTGSYVILISIWLVAHFLVKSWESKDASLCSFFPLLNGVARNSL